MEPVELTAPGLLLRPWREEDAPAIRRAAPDRVVPRAGQPGLLSGVAERAGYRLEGTMRESHRYGDGRRYDEHLHARLATDA